MAVSAWAASGVYRGQAVVSFGVRSCYRRVDGTPQPPQAYTDEARPFLRFLHLPSGCPRPDLAVTVTLGAEQRLLMPRMEVDVGDRAGPDCCWWRRTPPP